MSASGCENTHSTEPGDLSFLAASRHFNGQVIPIKSSTFFAFWNSTAGSHVWPLSIEDGRGHLLWKELRTHVCSWLEAALGACAQLKNRRTLSLTGKARGR